MLFKWDWNTNVLTPLPFVTAELLPYSFYVSGSTISHFTAPSRRGKLYCCFTVSWRFILLANLGRKGYRVLICCCIAVSVLQKPILFSFLFFLKLPFLQTRSLYACIFVRNIYLCQLNWSTVLSEALQLLDLSVFNLSGRLAANRLLQLLIYLFFILFFYFVFYCK